MKKIYIFFIVAAMLSVSTFTMNAQSSKLEKANADFNILKYADARKKYLDLTKKGNVSEEVLQNLGDVYYYNSDYSQSKEMYELLYTTYKEKVDKIYLLRYAQSLLAVGNASEAEVIYDKFLKKGGVNNDFKSVKDYIKIIDKHTDRYVLGFLPINSKGTDFGGFINDGHFYFSSNNSSAINKKIDQWSDKNFLDIKVADYDEVNHVFGTVKEPKGKLSTKYHDSSPIITKDGNTMYFTRTSVSLDKKNKGKQIDRLKIYKASKINGKWDAIEDLSINGETYSNAHPALSNDEKKLYFSSDMPTTLGQTDIFYVDIDSNGSLGTPQNLGPSVNTVGRESFPYISSDNELYFSSDGHFGFGGLDVYYIDLSKDNKQLFNIGAPINSSSDDFSFSINNKTNKGFFSSNRNQDDNIYSIVQILSVKSVLLYNIRGLVVDAATNKPLANVNLKVLDKNNNIIAQFTSNNKGEYAFELNTLQRVVINAETEGYKITTVPVEVREDSNVFNISMTKNEIEWHKNNDLAKILKLKNIYFNFDSARLRSDALVELDKIVLNMVKSPKLHIEVRSHTDNRANEAYNMKLSYERATSTLLYLIKKGINPNRLSAKGFGESQPLHKCEVCTEAQNQENRRSEFIIIND
ncbi:OmpA family protein [Flavobacterium sp.]|uniref:OmpA family protein n=1 Tax=Flavobacterium sp. TaxID=239 RepID=UPI003C4CB4C1